jgi:hypothetical protein
VCGKSYRPGLVIDGATVPAGIGSDLEPVSKFQGWSELVFLLLLIGTSDNRKSAMGRPKLRSNFSSASGLHGPSSDITWRKTHRVGGRVLILLGLSLIPLAFYLDSATNLWVTGAVVVGTALILVIYSYFPRRGDPHSQCSDRTAVTPKQS